MRQRTQVGTPRGLQDRERHFSDSGAYYARRNANSTDIECMDSFQGHLMIQCRRRTDSFVRDALTTQPEKRPFSHGLLGFSHLFLPEALFIRHCLPFTQHSFYRPRAVHT